MDFRLEFAIYPRSADGGTSQCPDVVRTDKLLHFQLEPRLDKLVLTSDCGSDMWARAEKDELWDWNRCACHCLNIVVQVAFKEPIIAGYVEPLTTLTCRLSKSRSAWNRSKKTQMEILNWEEGRSDDERKADFDRDEDFKVGGEGQPRFKKVLRLLRPMVTHWNFMYYTIKRALALKNSLVVFTNSERARNGEYPTMSPIDDNVEVFIQSYSCTTTPIHPSYARKLCSHDNPRNTQNQLRILAELQRLGRMHGATEDAEFIVGILHGAHHT